MKNADGKKDPLVRLLRDLLSKEGRERHKQFCVEGEEMIRRAVSFGGKINALILTEKFAATPQAADLITQAGVEVFSITEGLLSTTLKAKPNPGCIAIVERRVATLSDIFSVQNALVVMVEHMENADNLGMLLRSTDASGVTGVILTTDTTDPFGHRVIRGSRGAVFTVPICITRDSEITISAAKRCGLQIIAASARSDIPYTNINLIKPTMIVVGNEHSGISETVRNQSDAVVRIQMFGRINSLNVAVAASVILYEALRQRNLPCQEPVGQSRRAAKDQ